MIKDDLIKNIHKIMRKDPFISSIFQSAGLSLDNIESTMEDIKKQYWMDTATWGVDIWESILAIKTDATKAIEDRRSLVEAKWKSDSKVDLYLLQIVANSWKNGEVAVGFIGGKIKLTFNGAYGIPTDLDNLIKALDDVKPAHLALFYVFAYLLIKDIHNVLTINEMQTIKMREFAGGVRDV